MISLKLEEWAKKKLKSIEKTDKGTIDHDGAFEIMQPFVRL